MLKTLRLQNFQCHKKLEIKFSPAITTIVGSTDVGKSAVVRALSYLAFNTPSGMDFIKDGTSGCTVSLDTDKHNIKRRRGKSVNHYEVDGKRFEALGKGGVPDAVVDAVCLDRLNFQYQHDAPLWLSESSVQVARNINEIVNLDLIDRVLSRLVKRSRFVSSELTVCENRLIRAKSDAQDLLWVEEACVFSLKIETTKAKLDSISQEHTELLALVDSIQRSKKRLSVIAEVLGPAKEELEKIEGLRKTLKETQQRCIDFSRLVKEVKEKYSEVHEVKQRLDQAKKKLKEVKACPVCLRPFESSADIPF